MPYLNGRVAQILRRTPRRDPVAKVQMDSLKRAPAVMTLEHRSGFFGVAWCDRLRAIC